MHHSVRITFVLSITLTALGLSSPLRAQSRQAPPGMFKDLDDEILGDALIIHGKQLFIDDFVISELQGVQKTLNQPVKHPQNPVLIQDQPWEEAGPGFGTVIFDKDDGLFKLWYEVQSQTEGPGKTGIPRLCYATSQDGITWQKPLIDAERGTNFVSPPKTRHFMIVGLFKDDHERDPERRYKMHYVCSPDGSEEGSIDLPQYMRSLRTSVGWSPDGIHWTAASETPQIPFSDSPSCPFWDMKINRYVSYLRYGPPNTRKVTRIESEDFMHWSPKVTVIRPSHLDGPLATQFYQTSMFPYEGHDMGLITTYHSESLSPIPQDKPWTDRKNIQLVYSRNGTTWLRVGRQGAISATELNHPDRDWKQTALDATFIPYGEMNKAWDWGTVSTVYTPAPIIVGDEIWMYYTGIDAKNWWTHVGDPPVRDPNVKEPNKGVGLATLRLDGFVSVDAGDEPGTLTMKTLVFLGDTLVVNANAAGGSLTVEAFDAEGIVIEGFGAADCTPITTDSVRHVVKWKDNPDCHLLQGRPIKLRFHLKNAKLYAIEPKILHNHYLQSYD
ncbi:MAG: hypothetical protein EXS05_22585 [Planctomycetaceae bacterium]|nr:hypothetical protein [Planctomycetaceae bacterium]